MNCGNVEKRARTLTVKNYAFFALCTFFISESEQDLILKLINKQVVTKIWSSDHIALVTECVTIRPALALPAGVWDGKSGGVIVQFSPLRISTEDRRRMNYN